LQLNPSVTVHQRKYVSEIRRCDEIERKLGEIRKEVAKDKLLTIVEADDDEVIAYPNTREMAVMEATIDKCEAVIGEVAGNLTKLYHNQLELEEFESVLQQSELFLDENISVVAMDEEANDHQLHVFAGTIECEKFFGFERMLWRVSQGNALLRHAEADNTFINPKTVS